MAKKTTWISVIVGIVLSICVLAVAAIGGAAYWFSQHIDRKDASVESAHNQFERIRGQFGGQQPLIDVEDNEKVVVHQPPAPDGAPRPITTFHVLAYDAEEEALTHVDVPFWILKLAPKSQFATLTKNPFVRQKTQLDARDLERRGPGLVMDLVDRPKVGTRVLIWTD